MSSHVASPLIKRPLSPRSQKEADRVFNQFDSTFDEDGTITQEELFLACGITDDDHAKGMDLFRSLDVDGSGHISREEFYRFIADFRDSHSDSIHYNFDVVRDYMRKRARISKASKAYTAPLVYLLTTFRSRGAHGLRKCSPSCSCIAFFMCVCVAVCLWLVSIAFVVGGAMHVPAIYAPGATAGGAGLCPIAQQYVEFVLPAWLYYWGLRTVMIPWIVFETIDASPMELLCPAESESARAAKRALRKKEERERQRRGESTLAEKIFLILGLIAVLALIFACSFSLWFAMQDSTEIAIPFFRRGVDPKPVRFQVLGMGASYFSGVMGRGHALSGCTPPFGVLARSIATVLVFLLFVIAFVTIAWTVAPMILWLCSYCFDGLVPHESRAADAAVGEPGAPADAETGDATAALEVSVDAVGGASPTASPKAFVSRGQTGLA
jgi:hypothetical protein